MIRTILSIIFVIICIALSAIILLQEGKTQGLGSIGGMADTYWGRNKGRSMEGKLEKFTRYGAILFFVLALVLNLNILERLNTLVVRRQGCFCFTGKFNR